MLINVLSILYKIKYYRYGNFGRLLYEKRVIIVLLDRIEKRTEMNISYAIISIT